MEAKVTAARMGLLPILEKGEGKRVNNKGTRRDEGQR